jgi:hypothetical protein
VGKLWLWNVFRTWFQTFFPKRLISDHILSSLPEYNPVIPKRLFCCMLKDVEYWQFAEVSLHVRKPGDWTSRGFGLPIPLSIPSWDANTRSATWEILRPLWNLKVRYSVHKSSTLIPIHSHFNPAHNLPPYLFKVLSSISLPSTSRCSKWSFSLRFSDHYFVCFSRVPHGCSMHHPSYLP